MITIESSAQTSFSIQIARYPSTLVRGHHSSTKNMVLSQDQELCANLLLFFADHCIDNLRQRIMCTADVGLVPFYWVGDDGQTDPEFSRTHTCRNFETLHDWMMQHMVTLDSNATLLPRPGDYRVDHFH